MLPHRHCPSVQKADFSPDRDQGRQDPPAEGEHNLQGPHNPVRLRDKGRDGPVDVL